MTTKANKTTKLLLEWQTKHTLTKQFLFCFTLENVIQERLVVSWVHWWLLLNIQTLQREMLSQFDLTQYHVCVLSNVTAATTRDRLTRSALQEKLLMKTKENVGFVETRCVKLQWELHNNCVLYSLLYCLFCPFC